MGVRRGGGKTALVLSTVVLALVFVLASCASRSAGKSQGAEGRSAGTTTATGTAVRTFAAYDAAGRLTVKVGDVGTGSCFTSSIAADGTGAYRCFAAGNKILDPCFAPPGKSSPTSVACLTDPWSPATVITLTARLPVAQESGNRAEAPRPWAIQLRNGARCVAATGTVPTVHGVALTYRCTDGAAAALVGPLPATTRGTTLSAEYGRAPYSALTRLRVSTVWRG